MFQNSRDWPISRNVEFSMICELPAVDDVGDAREQEVRPQRDDERVELADADQQAVEQADAGAGQQRQDHGRDDRDVVLQQARSTTIPVTVITVTGVRSMPPPITTSVAKAAAMPITATAS